MNDRVGASLQRQCVRVVQGVGDLARELLQREPWQRASFLDHVEQCGAGHPFHGDEPPRVFVCQIVDAHDVGVIEQRSESRLGDLLG